MIHTTVNSLQRSMNDWDFDLHNNYVHFICKKWLNLPGTAQPLSDIFEDVYHSF